MPEASRWGLIVRPLGDLVHLVALAGLGYGMSEAVGFAVGRKRGRRLQIAAGAGVALAGLVSMAITAAASGAWSLFDVLAVALGVYVAAIRLR